MRYLSPHTRILASYGDCEEDAKFQVALLKQQRVVERIQLMKIGLVVGTYSDPGTVTLFFVGRHR